MDSCILDLDVILLPPLGEINAAAAASPFQNSNKGVEGQYANFPFFTVNKKFVHLCFISFRRMKDLL